MSGRPADGCLIDLDGTVYVDDEPFPWAVEAIAALRAARVPFRFATNTTRKPRRAIAAKLRTLGIETGAAECITAPSAASGWLRARGARRLSLLLAEASFEEFDGFELDDESPEYVLVGDLGPAWTFERLDRAFRALMAGAELVAIQRNRYWRHQGRLTLDAGPFVAALEYATGKKARLVGKPSTAFFTAAAAELGLPPARVAMVGDDLDADVRGAREAGLVAVALRTGKYRPEVEEETRAAASVVLDSLAGLPGWLGLAQRRRLNGVQSGWTVSVSLLVTYFCPGWASTLLVRNSCP